MATNDGESGLATAYAQKFWDAGNQVVTLIFALAFGVYLSLAGSIDIRCLAAERLWHLVSLAIIGNALLGFVLYRLGFHELRVVKMITSDSEFLDSVKSAFHLRLGLLLFNTVLYLAIVGFISYRVTDHLNHDPKYCGASQGAATAAPPKT